ncbi:hypothetical protein RclHR1_15560004 [Rhizophagus clarus]|uniref:Uncharacterized protein n=1 Tax=Rhizophagus clarus TaxID=94130 RepID=A0A2Z6QFM2_9GLOM|nr:hypothetical protein RclHR1_15560004 [Rhizophagus clarus]
MERMCGILQLLIKSRIKPYSNLANSKERVFGIEEYREEFYSPFIQYSLPIQEYKHLVKFYEGLRNINYDVEKEVINNYGVKYGRLRTSDGQYVSSYWIKRNNKIARNNYCIQIRRMIDKVAYRPNAPSQLAIVNIYGIVNYYLVHEFNHQVYMLVYIQLTSKNIEDEYEYMEPSQSAHTEVNTENKIIYKPKNKYNLQETVGYYLKKKKVDLENKSRESLSPIRPLEPHNNQENWKPL